MAYDRSRLFIENLRCSPIIVVPMTRNTDLSRPYPVYFGLFWHSVQLAHMSPGSRVWTVVYMMCFGDAKQNEQAHTQANVWHAVT